MNSATLGGSVLDPQSRPLPLVCRSNNAAPGSARSSAWRTLDFALVRDFTVVERAGFQFAAGFFDGPNRSHPGMSNRFVNTPPIGSITRPASPFERVDSFLG
jgi:hypothetical protein